MPNNGGELEIALRAAETRALGEVDPATSRLQSSAESPPIATARYELTKWVLWVFLILVMSCFVCIAADAKTEKINLAIDILKTMLLPLVTLMIGHYFGSRSES